MTPVETPPEATPAPLASQPKTKPVIRRMMGRDNGDTVGIGWLHGSFQMAVFRRAKMTGSWSAPEPVKTMAELEKALDDGLQELKFGGTEAFLLLENEQFIHQIESTPPLSDSMARGFLHSKVQRFEKENAAMLWVAQPAGSAKKERSFILHMLSKTFYESVNRMLLERRLDLTRILPLVVPVQRELDRFPISKGRPVLVAVEAGGATVVMVAKVGEELLFARNILATWSADPGRIGVEINRSLLFTNQQFGTTVDRVWLLGEDNHATAEVNAKCGTGRQITVLPTSPVEWLQSAAKLAPRQPINLVAGHLRRKSRQLSLRRGLLIGAWVCLALLGVDAWVTAQAWNQEQRQYTELQAYESKMGAERERLLERNKLVEKQRAFVKQVDGDRLPAVPGKFAAYVSSVLPQEIRLTELTVKWEEGVGWTFRLEGVVEADEETSHEIVASLQRALARSPLRVHSNELPRPAAPVMRNPNLPVPEFQKFAVEGGMLEN